MKSHHLKLKVAPWALLSVSASWGLAFVLMKGPIARQSVSNFLFDRFTLAVLVMFLLKPTVFRLFTKDLVLRGLGAGLFLGTGYMLQTMGLERTGAAVTGFITGLYVVATPLIAAIFLREKISRLTWACVLLATVGMGFLSLHGWSVGIGELYVFASALAFGAHIVALSRWSSGRDAYAMTIVQLFACALLSSLFAAREGFMAPPDLEVWLVVLFTAVICTALAFMVQTWSQAHMSATKVAVILTMEVVFAALFAVLFGGERLSAQVLIGGVMVIIAMYIIVIKES